LLREGEGGKSFIISCAAELDRALENVIIIIRMTIRVRDNSMLLNRLNVLAISKDTTVQLL
jgi:hypothetical protein